MTKHLLAVLATWRITSILTEEDAPFDFALKLREYAYNNSEKPNAKVARDIAEKLGITVKTDYHVYHEGSLKSSLLYEVHKVLSCKWCASVWVGLLVTGVTKVNPLWAFAYSAGSLLFGKLFNAIPLYVHGESESWILDNGN